MKKAFTIVELLMVIGIISVLLTLVAYASIASLKRMREKKAEAGQRMIQQGLATYYAQKGQWPGSIGQDIKNGNLSSDDSEYELTVGQISDMMNDLIEATRSGNPMLDLSILYVSKDSGEDGSRGYGMDFQRAITGTKKNPEPMSINGMNFGYVDPDTGYFRRYHVYYSFPSDEMVVKKNGEKMGLKLK